MYQILLCDDEKDIVTALEIYLRNDDYKIFKAYNGADALKILTEEEIHLVLLDIMMPHMDGIAALTKLREFSNVPVILLTAKSEDIDKVLGLTVGADDYITKPFGTSELLARIRAAIRHFRGTSKNQGEKQKVTFLNGKLVIDYDKHRVYVEEQDAGLTQNEFRLLSLLGKYAGKVLTYDYMMKEIWGPNMKGDNRILRVNMANIRRKIEKNPGQPQFIFTEVGVGYRIIETDS